MVVGAAHLPPTAVFFPDFSQGLRKMDYRAAIISSVWIAIAIISAVYMWVFADKIGDVLFGVFLPVGLLVLAAIIVTIIVSNSESKSQ